MALAYWCVLVAGLLPILTVAIAKAGGGLDNGAPRDWAAGLTGYRRRAHAAHANHFEAFPFFAAAVLAAIQQGAPMGPVNALAAAFVLARLAYTGCYVADLPVARSIVWSLGWFATLALFLLPLAG